MPGKIRNDLYTTRLIRSAIDSYPDGLCFAASDGRPILTSRAMNRICYEITGHTVTNMEQMWDALSENAFIRLPQDPSEPQAYTLLCRTEGGQIWQFLRQSLSEDRWTFYRYDASDVTALYRYHAQLEENIRLTEQLQRRQQKLLKNIAQNNLERELLNAKIHIHDTFGQLLVMTKKALADTGSADAEDTRNVFRAWSDAAKDMETSSDVTSAQRNTSPEAELLKVADMIGCRIVIDGKRPEGRTAQLLMYSAIREALTNAVRHGGADILRVTIAEKEKGYRVEIRNNGKPAVRPVRETGGLRSLREKAELEGASLEYIYKDGLTLVLTLPGDFG